MYLPREKHIFCVEFFQKKFSHFLMHQKCIKSCNTLRPRNRAISIFDFKLWLKSCEWKPIMRGTKVNFPTNDYHNQIMHKLIVHKIKCHLSRIISQIWFEFFESFDRCNLNVIFEIPSKCQFVTLSNNVSRVSLSWANTQSFHMLSSNNQSTFVKQRTRFHQLRTFHCVTIKIIIKYQSSYSLPASKKT